MKLFMISFLSLLIGLTAPALANPTSLEENLTKQLTNSNSQTNNKNTAENQKTNSNPQTNNKNTAKNQKTNSNPQTNNKNTAENQKTNSNSQTDNKNTAENKKTNSNSQTDNKNTAENQKTNSNSQTNNKNTAENQKTNSNSQTDNKNTAKNQKINSNPQTDNKTKTQPNPQTDKKTTDKTQQENSNSQADNESTPSNNESTKDKKWVLGVKNSFLLHNNHLLKTKNNFAVSMPYSEVNFTYNVTEKLFFEIELEFSYKNRSLDIKFDDLLLKYTEDSFFLPFSFQWGHFRMDYIKSNSKLFHKKALVHQSLFPYGSRALGIALEINFTDFLSLLTGWQAYHNVRETDGFQSPKPASTISSYLLYKTNNTKAFMGYLHQKLLLEGFLSAYGTGADLKHSYKDWLFKFKTEVWKIKKTKPHSEIISGYLFPYVKWNSLIGTGFVIGSSQEKLPNNKAIQFENIAKLDLYFTKESYFSVERVKEYSSIFTKNSWNFAIKSKFKL